MSDETRHPQDEVDDERRPSHLTDDAAEVEGHRGAVGVAEGPRASGPRAGRTAEGPRAAGPRVGRTDEDAPEVEGHLEAGSLVEGPRASGPRAS